MMKWLFSLLFKRKPVDKSRMTHLLISFNVDDQNKDLIDAIYSLGYSVELSSGTWYVRTIYSPSYAQDEVVSSVPKMPLFFAVLNSASLVSMPEDIVDTFNKYWKKEL